MRIADFGFPDLHVGLQEKDTGEIIDTVIPGYAYLTFVGDAVCHMLVSRPDAYVILGRPFLLANYVSRIRKPRQSSAPSLLPCVKLHHYTLINVFALGV